MHSSPLNHVHELLGAKLVEFAGWSMPVQYSGVIDEHQAVRERCGVFDVSHLGRFRLGGPDAIDLLQSQLCNDVGALGDGRAQYTMALNEKGGVVDDIIVWRLGPEDTWVMPNGVNHDRILQRFRDAEAAVSISDERPQTVLLAVQGPDAPSVLATVLEDVPGRFRCLATTTSSGSPVFAAGTGYTGERGAELIVGREDADALWFDLVKAGAQPCGLGARDTLRLEVGYPLWGQDLDEMTSPLEAGLDWVVDWDHEFVGRSALVTQRDQGLKKRLVGFTTGSRRIARTGAPLRKGSATGVVTSGNFSPGLGHGIGLGYLSGDDVGAPAEVEIRGDWHEVTIVDPPFVKAS